MVAIYFLLNKKISKSNKILKYISWTGKYD